MNRRVPLPPLCDDCRRARERAVALSLYAPPESLPYPRIERPVCVPFEGRAVA